jgi:hypothetical protein
MASHRDLLCAFLLEPGGDKVLDSQVHILLGLDTATALKDEQPKFSQPCRVLMHFFFFGKITPSVSEKMKRERLHEDAYYIPVQHIWSFHTCVRLAECWYCEERKYTQLTPLY